MLGEPWGDGPPGAQPPKWGGVTPRTRGSAAPLRGLGLSVAPKLQGLVAQGHTLAETMEIAQDVARKLIESCIEHGDPLPPSVYPNT